MAQSFKALVKTRLAKAGIHVFRTLPPYAQDGLVTIHNDHFRRDPAFGRLIAGASKPAAGLIPALSGVCMLRCGRPRQACERREILLNAA